jgi:hypothetical protein
MRLELAEFQLFERKKSSLIFYQIIMKWFLGFKLRLEKMKIGCDILSSVIRLCFLPGR